MNWGWAGEREERGGEERERGVVAVLEEGRKKAGGRCFEAGVREQVPGEATCNVRCATCES